MTTTTRHIRRPGSGPRPVYSGVMGFRTTDAQPTTFCGGDPTTMDLSTRDAASPAARALACQECVSTWTHERHMGVR